MDAREEVPFDVPGEGGRIRERYAIDVGGATQALSDIDEAKLARGKRADKMKFLSPSQLPVGINVLKILPPWTTTPPHAGRFWRAVWVHFGLGPTGETKTALCTRRMNKLGLPRRKDEDSLGPCAVCEALEQLWAVPFEQRLPEEKKALSDYRPRLNYLFNVVWLKGGGKSRIDDGAQVFACSPKMGEPIPTAFKFVLSMKPAEIPDNFDVQIKKLPAEGKFFAGKQVYDYGEVFPSIPTIDLDLADPRFERFTLDGIYKQKESETVEALFRQTACGSRLLGSAPATSGEHRTMSAGTTAEEPADERPPFVHRPAGRGESVAGTREPGSDDLSPDEEAMLAALAARKKGGATRDFADDLMRVARK